MEAQFKKSHARVKLGKRRNRNKRAILEEINIVSFDVPYPANYGGVIDVFYKIKSFYEARVGIHLHCFEYGRGEQKELNRYCKSVTYYKRKTGVKALLGSTPYIVKSRTSDVLKQNLQNNNAPILFEGIHCCHLLGDPQFNNRFKIVRCHNVEHEYYYSLSLKERRLKRQQFYLSESRKLKKYESILKKANLLIPISLNDLHYFKRNFPDNNILFVPAFHKTKEPSFSEGIGKYVLYHGNLSVRENISAAEYIIRHIFKDLNIPLIIAGLNPPPSLLKLINKFNHISLVKNPTDIQMEELISQAQINLLFTHQATGLKLKLLNALHLGKHCMVNSKMLIGTNLDSVCLIGDNSEELRALLSTNFEKQFTERDFRKRKRIIHKDYSNENNINKIINKLELL